MLPVLAIRFVLGGVIVSAFAVIVIGRVLDGAAKPVGDSSEATIESQRGALVLSSACRGSSES